MVSRAMLYHISDDVKERSIGVLPSEEQQHKASNVMMGWFELKIIRLLQNSRYQIIIKTIRIN